MEYNAKRAKLSGVVYIILALMIAAIMCMTLFTFISSRRETPPEDTAALTTPHTEPVSDKAAGAGTSAPETQPVEETKDASQTEKPVSASDPLSFIMPLDGIVSAPYSGELPVFSVTMNDYRTHMGIDIEAPEGTSVVSCADGVICNIYNDDMRGRCVEVDHGDGIKSVYRGLSEELPDGIEVGVEVVSGTVIGSVGDTALFEVAQASHLHFELSVNGNTVDPLKYLPYDADKAAMYYGG